MAVHVLGALTCQGGAPGGCADDESLAHLVAGCPEGVTGALESEHRVEQVDRHHRHALGGVGRTGSDEGSRRACLVDAGVQDLAVPGLAVAEHELVVHRGVVLAVRVVDLDRREERVHAEGTGLVRDDRDDVRGEVLVAHEILEQTHESHGGGDFLLARSTLDTVEGLLLRDWQRGELQATLRHETTQSTTTLHEVLDALIVGARVEVRGAVRVGLQDLVGDRDLETVTELLEVFEGQLLHLVGRVAAREVGSEVVALDGAGEHHGRSSPELGGGLVGVVDLAIVVATATQRPNLFVGPVLDHLGGARITTEEVLTDIGAVVGLKGLVVAVTSVVHDVDKSAVAVSLQQRIPARSPDDLDDVPAGTAEDGLQLLDDLAVATYWAVQTLKVAVDDEGEVVEFLIGGNLQEATRLRLVHLAVAEEGPDVLVGAVLDTTVGEVLVHGRLVDGVHRPQTH